MPVPDPDGGINFQGYNPKILTGRSEPPYKPFYFGGSQVPMYLNKINNSNQNPTLRQDPTKKVIKKLP